MNIKSYFENIPYVDVTAAHIGINKWDWIDTPDKNLEQARYIMTQNRFDVLPVTINGVTESYFRTTQHNDYSSIKLYDIKDTDKVYYRLSLDDLITKFCDESRFFYFLTDHSQLVGLVSIVNLSCQPSYNYFFQLISQLERRLSGFLKQKFSEEKVIDMLSISTDSHAQDLLTKFKESKVKGIDLSIFEMMYLQTLSIILKKASDSLEGKERDLLNYRIDLAAGQLFSNIRNTVMHPVKTIINDTIDIEKLSLFLVKINQLNELLDEIEN